MKGHAKIAVYCAETLKLDGWALDVGKKSPISMATARGYLPLAEKLTALCGPEPERYRGWCRGRHPGRSRTRRIQETEEAKEKVSVKTEPSKVQLV